MAESVKFLTLIVYLTFFFSQNDGEYKIFKQFVQMPPLNEKKRKKNLPDVTLYSVWSLEVLFNSPWTEIMSSFLPKPSKHSSSAV